MWWELHTLLKVDGGCLVPLGAPTFLTCRSETSLPGRVCDRGHQAWVHGHWHQDLRRCPALRREENNILSHGAQQVCLCALRLVTISKLSIARAPPISISMCFCLCFSRSVCVEKRITSLLMEPSRIFGLRSVLSPSFLFPLCFCASLAHTHTHARAQAHTYVPPVRNVSVWLSSHPAPNTRARARRTSPPVCVHTGNRRAWGSVASGLVTPNKY